MKLAECEKFPKDRPQAALTVARSELLAGGSDETFHRMVHDALAFSLRLRRPDRADGRPVYNPDRDPPPAVRTRRQHLDPGPAPPSPTSLCDQRDQQAGGCGAGREISGSRRRAVADSAHHAKAQSRLDRPADVQSSVNDEHFPSLRTATSKPSRTWSRSWWTAPIGPWRCSAPSARASRRRSPSIGRPRRYPPANPRPLN